MDCKFVSTKSSRFAELVSRGVARSSSLIFLEIVGWPGLKFPTP